MQNQKLGNYSQKEANFLKNCYSIWLILIRPDLVFKRKIEYHKQYLHHMGDCVFNWIGTIAGWVLGIITTNYYNIYKKFEGECQIKGELEDIAHDLDVSGRPNEKITIRYGASYIRHHTQKLFGEHNAEALGYYTHIFEPYNRKMENTTISYDEHHRLQHGLKNRMNGILVMNPWLKTIPSEPSIIGFIKYLLKREAESTYIPIREH